MEAKGRTNVKNKMAMFEDEKLFDASDKVFTLCHKKVVFSFQHFTPSTIIVFCHSFSILL